MTTCFNYYYAAVSAYGRPQGMDMHPRMIAYRMCAQHLKIAQNYSEDCYKMFIFRNYAEIMRESAKFLTCRKDVAEVLFDCCFYITLEQVAEKVWKHFHTQS